MSPTTTYYRATTDGGCDPVETSADEHIYELGAELPPGEFVAADLRVRGSTRLAPYELVAEDGAVQADSIWDGERAAECAPRGEEPDSHCAPRQTAVILDDIWADASCSVPAAVDFGLPRWCAPPTAIANIRNDVFLELGEEVSSTQVHRSEGGMCIPGGVGPGDPVVLDRVYYLHGPAIATTSMPALVPVRDGSGRLRAVSFTDEQGQRLAMARTLEDTALGLTCFPYRSVDGFRCVPSAFVTIGSQGSGSGLFADPSCTSPLAVWLPDKERPRVIVTSHDPVDACDTVSVDEAHEAGPVFTGTTIYTRAPMSSECNPRASDPGVSYLTLGAKTELPPVHTD